MWRLPVVCVLLLAACRQTWGTGDNEANLISNQALPRNTADHISANSAAAANESSNDEDGPASGSLPPPDAPLRFVGLWASNEANCSGRAWRFTADAVRSADGPNCSIYKVSKAPGGYDLAARCPASRGSSRRVHNNNC